MAQPDLLLVNPNRSRPPVAPIGLDYLAGALTGRGFLVHLLDLAFADDLEEAVLEYFDGNDPRLVGLSIRNTDDCQLAGGTSFVPGLEEVVGLLRSASDAPLVLGGCGYSLFPGALLDRLGADYGIVGDGEEPLAALISHRRSGKPARDLPGLVVREGGAIHVTPPAFAPRLTLPTGRSFVDNARYFREGGQGGFEGKRGCSHRCIYCADPAAKGRSVRRRDPEEVVREIRSLLRQGVDVLHTCDPEFNVPPDHAAGVCVRLASRGLADRVRWYAYLAPAPLPGDLPPLMKQAGCVGVNIGADSACDGQLRRLGRGFSARQVAAAVEACKQAGLVVMVDLLIGGPGETPETCSETIRFVKNLPVDCVGAQVGVRVYPGTPLARAVRQAGPLHRNPDLRGRTEGNESFLEPIFFVSRHLGEDPAALVIDLIGDDRRFFPPAATGDARDYNYTDHALLADAIAAGARGAYWHILLELRSA